MYRTLFQAQIIRALHPVNLSLERQTTSIFQRESSPCLFPRNELEALTMLYMQNQNLTLLSPDQLLDKYYETYEQLKSYDAVKRAQKNRGTL